MTDEQWESGTDPAKMLSWLLDTNQAETHPLPVYEIGDRRLRLFACACVCQVYHLLTDERSRKAVEVAERYADGLAVFTDLFDACADAHAAWQARAQQNPAGMAYYASRDDIVYSVQRIVRPGLRDVDSVVQAALLRDIVGNPFRPVDFGDAHIPDCYVCERCDNRMRIPGVTVRRCPGCGELDHIRKYRQRDEWLTPLVLALATTAYDERAGVKCERCGGCGLVLVHAQYDPAGSDVPPDGYWEDCPACHGTGDTSDGRLDPDRLAVLADALEEAGCEGTWRYACDGSGTHSHDGRAGDVIHGVLHETNPRARHHHHDSKCPRAFTPHPLLAHLKSPGPHYRGMWSLDLILSKE